MKSFCVSQLSNEPLAIICQSLVEFCGGNHCAAAFLWFFFNTAWVSGMAQIVNTFKYF